MWGAAAAAAEFFRALLRPKRIMKIHVITIFQYGYIDGKIVHLFLLTSLRDDGREPN